VHRCAWRCASWVAAHWVLFGFVVWWIDAGVLVFLEIFLGFVFFGLGEAEFEEWDGQEGHCWDCRKVGSIWRTAQRLCEVEFNCDEFE